MNKPLGGNFKGPILPLLEVLRYLQKLECEAVGMEYPGNGYAYKLPDGTKNIKDILWGYFCDDGDAQFGNDRYYKLILAEKRCDTWEEESQFYLKRQAEALEGSWEADYYSDSRNERRRLEYEAIGTLLKHFSSSVHEQDETGYPSRFLLFWVCW